MDLNWFQTFVTAAKYENFRKTAETLFISQPSVTVHIKLLEEELGVKLFQRKGRSIFLTEEGKRFAAHANSLIEAYQKGLEDLHSFTQGYENKLSLAISPLIADTVLPSVLKRYLKEHDHVEIDVKMVESALIEDMVQNGSVDIGLSCLRVKSSTLQCIRIYEDPFLLVVPHDGLDLETGSPLDEEEILRTNYLLTHSHPDYWDDLLLKLKALYPSIKTMKVSQVHITKRFISEGLGVSYLPTSTIRRELLEGRLIDVESNLELPVAKTFAVYKYEHKIIEEFLDYIMKFRF
ncbi:LysR family transcriptional repressor of citA [Salirhabdus euzebyi]|uniref:LysR family transcriptional repressor of citA n=1 Tax=Salirhabdus euzebyi TaxID=394506 RepID=A0A841Q370_9BACI|nr:LysR family transcriptional regulator [Salirhabdus euzebyi]MBB6452778.1 LysR family transcriptional repressor of citA [Salirhabdus euzebyi]